MSTLSIDYPQHALQYEWQRKCRVTSNKKTKLTERYAHESRHHSRPEGLIDEISRGIDSGIRAVARAADWIDNKLIGWYRSTKFASRRGEYSDSAIYFD